MKKQVLIVLISMLSILTIVSCYTTQTKGIKGNLKIVKEERNIKAFTQIKAASIFKIYLKQGSPQSVVVETDENLIDMIQTSVSGGTLSLDISGNIQEITTLNIYITVENLTKIDISGVSKLEIETPLTVNSTMYIEMSGASVLNAKEINATDVMLNLSGAAKTKAIINCNTLDINSSGAANAKLEGKANKQTIKASGAVKINLQHMKSVETNVTASDAANVTIPKGTISNINSTGASSIQTK